jgi:hypothetical protein
MSFISGLEIVLNRLFLTTDNLQWSTGEAKKGADKRWVMETV